MDRFMEIEVMNMSRRVERSLRFGLTGMGLCISTTVWAVDQNNDLKGDVAVGNAPTPVGLLQVWGTVWDQDEEPATDPASYGDPEDDIGFKSDARVLAYKAMAIIFATKWWWVRQRRTTRWQVAMAMCS